MDDTTFSIPIQYVENCMKSFPDNEIGILQEECAELIQALSKLKRKDIPTGPYLIRVSKIKEEMAHVLISSAVVAKIYGITEDDILTEVEKKQIKYGFPIIERGNK